MMVRVLFTKGHGTGNDFVILPDPDGALDLTADQVRALCDRHFGLGADGVLRVVRTAKDAAAAEFADEAEWFMDYRNADGSIAEMCGNGVRVFAHYLVTQGWAAFPVPVATRAGVALARSEADAISVRMPPPRVYAAGTATTGGFTVPGVAVDCGNPHLVCTVSTPLDALDLTVAPEHDPLLFPDGVNVEFVTPVSDLHVRMRVHERGSGETLSCGSGALAVGAVVLRDAGRAAGRVTVDVLGGTLTVTATESGEWWLAGPAALVATGEVTV
jgi:diaminopimelate epimerase